MLTSDAALVEWRAASGDGLTGRIVVSFGGVAACIVGALDLAIGGVDGASDLPEGALALRRISAPQTLSHSRHRSMKPVSEKRSVDPSLCRNGDQQGTTYRDKQGLPAIPDSMRRFTNGEAL